MSLNPETVLPKELIVAFNKLLQDPFVFKPNTTDFSELITDLPDDINELKLAEKVKDWCRNRPKIYNSLKAALGHYRGAENTETDSNSLEARELRQQMLENIIRLGSPSLNSQQSDSPTSEVRQDDTISTD